VNRLHSLGRALQNPSVIAVLQTPAADRDTSVLRISEKLERAIQKTRKAAMKLVEQPDMQAGPQLRYLLDKIVNMQVTIHEKVRPLQSYACFLN
jgi:hypothetical protein